MFTNFWFFIFIIIWTYIILQFLQTEQIKYKFVFFLINISFFTIWGFLNNLDGIFLIIFQTEAILLYFFCFVFIQSKEIAQVHSFKKINKTLCVTILLFEFYFFFITQTTFMTLNLLCPITWDYYTYTQSIVIGDFFILFYFFYYQFPIFIFLLGAIITLFSCFFIFFYKLLKNLQNTKTKKNQYFYFLRKQEFIHQVKHKPQLRLFQ